MGWGSSLNWGAVPGLCPPFPSTPLGLAHARILVLTKGNKVVSAELIKEGGGRRVGAGKTSGHPCQVVIGAKCPMQCPHASSREG